MKSKMSGRKKIIISAIVISVFLIIIAFGVFYANRDIDSDSYVELREKMVENQIIQRGIKDGNVIEAMKKVPRHEFVDEDQKKHAYEDRPLPIGLGQTISQPYIVSLMTEHLRLDGDEKVLEVGTGSGYQAAVLSEITEDVYTVEIIPDLYKKSKKRLEKMYPRVMISNHDGYYGWKEYAPFDRIIVTAAPDHIPQPLINQLSENGIMVIPVGPPGWSQILWKVTRIEGELITEKIADVAFVPLTREN
jgi:protein-L-isoaspartate(D-aspartate) O-methyltransferase